ncbi:hypothetical protein GCM10009550_54000 [Actinocorallia libanotica]|uniref:Uncharacterized protein n=1 Tax=Actinocorallia libanotica TaxID=46162 RepID=A0ABP4C7Q3_9ACTN
MGSAVEGVGASGAVADEFDGAFGAHDGQPTADGGVAEAGPGCEVGTGEGLGSEGGEELVAAVGPDGGGRLSGGRRCGEEVSGPAVGADALDEAACGEVLEFGGGDA